MVSVLIAITALMAQAATAQPLLPHQSHRHCVCKEYGPRGGCRAWTCRTIRWVKPPEYKGP